MLVRCLNRFVFVLVSSLHPAPANSFGYCTITRRSNRPTCPANRARRGPPHQYSPNFGEECVTVRSVRTIRRALSLGVVAQRTLIGTDCCPRRVSQTVIFFRANGIFPFVLLSDAKAYYHCRDTNSGGRRRPKTTRLNKYLIGLAEFFFVRILQEG